MVAPVADSERELARVWLRKVIAPILEGTAIEMRRGAKGNWGFRASDRKLEFAALTSEMVAPNQLPNLEQFLRMTPQFTAQFAAHDAVARQLGEIAGRAFDAVLELPEFKQTTVGREEKRVVLAEYLLNHIDRLPDFYTLFSDWEEIGSRLRKAWRDHVSLGEEFSEFEDASDSLAKEASRLNRALTDFRDELADRFRLPAVDPDVA